MVLPVYGLQPAQRQMRVDLRSRDIRVAEQRLHGAQVGAMLDHVRRAAMPQHVRAGMAVRRLDQMPYPLACEWFAAHGEKESACGATFLLERRTALREIFFDSLNGR